MFVNFPVHEHLFVCINFLQCFDNLIGRFSHIHASRNRQAVVCLNGTLELIGHDLIHALDLFICRAQLAKKFRTVFSLSTF